MGEVIRVSNVGKRYRRYHGDRPPSFKEAALGGFGFMRKSDVFWALQDVSFSVRRGEMLGIVGHNGAGKSTLLQLIGGVGKPDKGSVHVTGRIGALLDLGAGLSADLTGRENVFVCAVAAGLSRREVDERFSAIVEFAELAEAIDNPVRTYSSGMQMRLAFSVAIHTDPEVLLVDEFLSVGDLAFQTKCLHRIAKLKGEGCAIVLISHAMDQVRDLCDRAIWLRQGEVVQEGSPEVVTAQYREDSNAETRRRTPHYPTEITHFGTELAVHRTRFGSLEAVITGVRLLPGNEIEAGDALAVEIQYRADQPIESPIFTVSINRGSDGQACFDVSTEAMGLTVPTVRGQGKIVLSIGRMDLVGGEYWVNVGLFEAAWAYAYDYHWEVYPLMIHSEFHQGIMLPPCRWHLETARSEPAVTAGEPPVVSVTDGLSKLQPEA